jgi:hypothetical protein
MLETQMGNDELSAVGSTPTLSMYGFADVGFYKFFIPDNPLRAVLPSKSAFAVGNLNLYLASELARDWRSLAEVRFTYLPNGSRSVVGTNVERVDTSANDYNGLPRPRQTGSILLERAWIEYAPSPRLIVRVGSWLTPYGIWNADHGSPTIIAVSQPYVIAFELLPERQTGVLIHGTTYLSQSLTLGYALGLSNGRGPMADYADLDENKGTTLRLYGVHRGAGVLTLGGSAYYGRYTDVAQSIVLDDAVPRFREQVTTQYDQLSIGFDARYVHGGFHAQAEFLWNDTAYTADGRPVRIGAQFEPDSRRMGGYIVLGYRLPWLGVMPYLSGEYFAFGNTFEPTRPPTTDVITYYALGINSRPTSNITLKLEGKLGAFFIENARGSAFEDTVSGVQAQVAWAF